MVMMTLTDDDEKGRIVRNGFRGRLHKSVASYANVK